MVKKKTLAIIMALSIMFSSSVNIGFAEENSNVETPIESSEDIEVVDTEPPTISVVNQVWDSHTKVTGQTEPGAIVMAEINSVQYPGTIDTNGNFSIDIKTRRTSGTNIKIIAKDEAGNTSYQDIIVIDKTAPSILIVNQVWDNHINVSGKTEANETVIVQIDKNQYTGISDKNGNFSVNIKNKIKSGTKVKITVKDKAGNSSYKEVTVIDKTAPNVPTANAVWDNHTKITGKGEPGSIVIVKVGSKVLGKSKVDIKGIFSINIQKQKPNTILNISSIDSAIFFTVDTGLVISSLGTSFILSLSKLNLFFIVFTILSLSNSPATTISIGEDLSILL